MSTRKKNAREKARTKQDSALVITHEHRLNSAEERARRDIRKTRRVRATP